MLVRRSLWSRRLRVTPAAADFEVNPVSGLEGWLPAAVALAGNDVKIHTMTAISKFTERDGRDAGLIAADFQIAMTSAISAYPRDVYEADHATG